MPHNSDPATIKTSMVADLYGYWLKRRGDRSMPRRADIDPTDIKSLLPNLFLTEFTLDPFRVRYRLIGTEIVNHAHFDFTGRYLDELDFSAYDEVDWQGLYRIVWTQGVPIFGDAVETFRDRLRAPAPYHFCILPLSADGVRPTGAVALEEYQKLSAHDRDQLPTVVLKDRP
jgi:PAS domain